MSPSAHGTRMLVCGTGVTIAILHPLWTCVPMTAAPLARPSRRSAEVGRANTRPLTTLAVLLRADAAGHSAPLAFTGFPRLPTSREQNMRR